MYMMGTRAAQIVDLYRSNGVPVAGLVLDLRSVVGPASLAAGGIPVDLSAAFSRIYSIKPTRAYTTATGVTDPSYSFEPNEEGTDVYASGKFRLKVKRTGSITPAGTNSAPVFTGAALAGHAHTFTGSALAGHTHTFTGGADVSSAVSAGTPSGTNAAPVARATVCVATCNCTTGTPNMTAVAFTGNALGTHTHTTTPTGTNSSDSAGTPAGTLDSVSAGTPAGTVAAPTFTGSATGQQAFAEVTATTNLSALTFEFVVEGVPL